MHYKWLSGHHNKGLVCLAVAVRGQIPPTEWGDRGVELVKGF